MVWFLQHSLWSKNLALNLKNKDLTFSWKWSKTANNPGNFTKIGESFIVVTSLVFSLEPIFLKISDRMSPTLALITLSSYPNQNTVEETRSATTIFFQVYHQDEGFSWDPAGHTDLRTPFSVLLSDLSPERFAECLTTRLRCASSSDSLRFSIMDMWSNIYERDIHRFLSQSKFHEELSGSIKVSNVYLGAGESAECVQQCLQRPVGNVTLQLFQLLFRENLHEVVHIQQDAVQINTVDGLWQETDHSP